MDLIIAIKNMPILVSRQCQYVDIPFIEFIYSYSYQLRHRS